MPLSAGERANKYREKKKLTDPEFLVKESERKKAKVMMMKITNTFFPSIQHHVVLDRSFVMLEGLHKRGDIQNRETIPGRLLTKEFGRWSLFSDNFLP